MKKLKRKLRARAGMTLTELLAAIAIMALLGTAISVGTSAALRVYRASTAVSEAGVLKSTLAAAIMDELRYATDIDAGASPVTYRSATYGKNVSITVDSEGRLLVKGDSIKEPQPLVGSKTYTSGLTVKALDIVYGEGVFTVTLTVGDADGELTSTAAFKIDPINE